ncbi:MULTISPECIES: DUF3093 domain-containing protein [Arthrobacter]|uniref:DUF3093 domain-containing protein n=2 Tax=Arthrobacter TaxID=1663 RepID=A0ABU9KGE1_9MICC|nr:DUF3093 domain-containing protein [Arthrobacter sp. YJM1]MDP5225852.1 DUF3093 domain-containing protein [Arthrobacter sp. YJM1]
MPESRPGSAAPSGTSPVQPLYSERLWPGLGAWMIVLVLSLAGILVLAPIGWGYGIAAAVVLFLAQGFALYASTPRIEVTETHLRAGKAVIERSFLGAAQAFSGDEAFQERGPRLNGLAYLCLRGWVDPVVRIEVLDPEDSTPYWLFSTRRPQQLLAALAS